MQRLLLRLRAGWIVAQYAILLLSCHDSLSNLIVIRLQQDLLGECSQQIWLFWHLCFQSGDLLLQLLHLTHVFLLDSRSGPINGGRVQHFIAAALVVRINMKHGGSRARRLNRSSIFASAGATTAPTGLRGGWERARAVLFRGVD